MTLSPLRQHVADHRDIYALLATLERSESYYAAVYAHWRSVGADAATATFEASSRAVGIRDDRRVAIRRAVDAALALEMQ